MSEQENVKVVHALFECFGRGDIPSMLNVISDDVVWRMRGTDAVPYFGERRGHAGVIDFFQQLGGSVAFESFEPQEFIAGGDHVTVIGREQGKVLETGKAFFNEWAMIFTLRDGKIERFRCYDDTEAVAAAFKGNVEVEEDDWQG